MTKRALTIGTEFVTVALPDYVQKIIWAWTRDHLDDLRDRLARTGFGPEEIQMPEFRRMVFEDDDEVVQAAIDSGHARRITNQPNRTQEEK